MRTSPLRYALALALLAAAPAFAQTSLNVLPSEGLAPFTDYALRGGVQITQNASTVIANGGVACALSAPNPSYVRENSYLRVFDLSVESLSDAISVQSVDFGIRLANLDSVEAGFVDTQVVLYRLAPGTPYTSTFPRTALTEVGRTTYRVTPIAAPGQVVTAQMAQPAIFQPNDLMVVEWAVPNGTAPQDSVGWNGAFNIRYGGNNEGVLASSYLSTTFPEHVAAPAACGGIDPTALGTGPLANPAFLELQWVVVVNASLGVAAEGGAPGRTIRLGDARPNPSAGRSVIPFSLEAAGAARVAVYDVLGREVAVLADREFTAGDHELALAEGTLAPGTYVVRLVTPEAALSQRLTVTR